MRLHGEEAVAYAVSNGLLLCKYADPTEVWRSGLTLREAERVLLEDPNLIYVEVIRGER